MGQGTAMNLYEFTVTGSRDFPVDMLRYDRCWPAHESDSTTMATACDPGALGLSLTIVMRGMRSPTVERWRSFGWSVNHGEAAPRG